MNAAGGMPGVDLAAEIAARYGATVAPGVVVQRVAPGVSARPLPVWDGKKLIFPDWKENQAAAKRAAVRKSQAVSARLRADDAERMQRLRDLHAAGATVAVMAEALGLSGVYTRSLLAREGLAVARQTPGPRGASVQRDGTIRVMVGEGASLDAIGAAVGIHNRSHLRKVIRSIMPEVLLPRANAARPRCVQNLGLPRGAAIAQVWAGRRATRADRVRALLAEGAGEARIGVELGVANQRHLRRIIRQAVPGYEPPRVSRVEGLEERDRTVAMLVAEHSYSEIAARLELTPAQVAASVKRSRKAGHLPMTDEAPLPRRRGSARKAGVKVHVARNALIMERHRAGATVEDLVAETGLTRECVKRVLWAAGEPPRYARTNLTAIRVARLPGLIAEGMSSFQIAAGWGISIKTLYAIASRAKIALQGRAVPHNKGKVEAETAARRAAVRDLVQRGFSDAVIMEKLGIGRSTVQRDVRELGLTGLRPRFGRDGGDAGERWAA